MTINESMHKGWTKHRVTCKKCKKSSRIQVSSDNKVLYTDHTPIVSCRFRPDLKWGFQCQCGNDSRLAKEEIPQVKTLVQAADDSVIKKIVKAARLKPENKFVMEIA